MNLFYKIIKQNKIFAMVSTKMETSKLGEQLSKLEDEYKETISAGEEERILLGNINQEAKKKWISLNKIDILMKPKNCNRLK